VTLTDFLFQRGFKLSIVKQIDEKDPGRHYSASVNNVHLLVDTKFVTAKSYGPTRDKTLANYASLISGKTLIHGSYTHMGGRPFVAPVLTV
jgi:hypothetical protein